MICQNDHHSPIQRIRGMIITLKYDYYYGINLELSKSINPCFIPTLLLCLHRISSLHCSGFPHYLGFQCPPEVGRTFCGIHHPHCCCSTGLYYRCSLNHYLTKYLRQPAGGPTINQHLLLQWRSLFSLF